jgi:2-methylcitrate dehydratase
MAMRSGAEFGWRALVGWIHSYGMLHAPDRELSGYWPGANPARVHIRLRSGAELEDTTIHFPGHPRNPVSDADLADKFRSLAEPVLGADRAAAVIEAVAALETVPDVAELVRLVTVPEESRP